MTSPISFFTSSDINFYSLKMVQSRAGHREHSSHKLRFSLERFESLVQYNFTGHLNEKFYLVKLKKIDLDHLSVTRQSILNLVT